MEVSVEYEVNKDLGECYLFMGNFDKAEEYYQKAAATKCAHITPYLGLAAVAVQRNAPEQALEYYAQAVDIKADERSLTGMALVELELKKYEAAFEHFTQALERNPVSIMALDGLVQAGYKLQMLESVLPNLEQSLLTVDRDSIRFMLAGCLVSLGRVTEAREQLENLLALNKDYEPAIELYNRLLKQLPH